MLSVAITLLAAFTQQPLPSTWTREWTVVVGNQATVLGTRDHAVFFGSARSVGAIDIRSGKVTWRHKVSGWSKKAVLGAKSVYFAEKLANKQSRLGACNSNGEIRLMSSSTSEIAGLAVDAENVYALLADGSVTAYNQATSQQTWTQRIRDGKVDFRTNLSAGQGIVVCTLEDGFVAYDAVNGTKLWFDKSAVAYESMILPGGLVVLRGRATKGVDARSGKERWNLGKAYLEWMVPLGDTLVGEDSTSIVGFDLRSGKEVFRNSGGEGGFRGDGGLASSPDGKHVWMGYSGATLLDEHGNVVWTTKQEFGRAPDLLADDHLVFSDGERILGYMPGALPPLPSDEAARAALAKQLVDDYETLDETQRDQLVPLARYATRPLLKRYQQWALEKDKPRDGGRGMLLYSILEDLGPRLDKMLTLEDSDELIAVTKAVGASSWWGERVLTLLVIKHADPAKSVPIFLEILKAKKGQKDGDGSESELEIVANAKTQLAVQFMIDALADQKAPSTWRHEAFVNLPRTGGEAGLSAVRAARAKRTKLIPWTRRFSSDPDEKPKQLATAKDKKGHTWMLCNSGILGNHSDLFIVQKVGVKWGTPLFLGVHNGRTFRSDAPNTFRGVAIAKLVKSEWIKLFPDDIAIRKDSDRDGLTDLVEARYGTSPIKADTDGDGWADAVDPCPNAAPRKLDDKEKIVAVCVEARFFDYQWKSPAVIEVEGVKPFELYGYQDVLMWGGAASPSPLSSVYGGGMNSLSLESPLEIRSGPNVEFAPDGKSARTIIRRASGGLNGDGIEAMLVKVGDEWFVTSLTMRCVS